MIYCYTSKGDKSNTKWHRKTISSNEKANHHKWKGHNNRIENHKWLRKTMKLERQNREDNNKRDEKC